MTYSVQRVTLLTVLNQFFQTKKCIYAVAAVLFLGMSFALYGADAKVISDGNNAPHDDSQQSIILKETMKNDKSYLEKFLNVSERFHDKAFLGQFIRTLGKTYTQCADIGESFVTTWKIEDGNFESWYTAWKELGERIEGLAKKSLEGGHNVTARECFLRASEYYRQSVFFLRANLEDRRIMQETNQETDTFLQASRLFDAHVEPITISFEGGLAIGYFLHPSKPRRDGAIVVIPSGYDGTAEELYSLGGKAALDRGYNVFVFDGPGQGRVLYQHKLYMRPDFERTLTPVIDWLVKRPEVNKNKIALIGRSLGGYLAPRAVAYGENRIAALVCDPGQMDIAGMALRMWPKEVIDLWKAGDVTGVNDFYKSMIKGKPALQFYFESRMASNNAKTFFDFLNDIENYTFKDKIENIKCPTLVLDNPTDAIVATEGKKMYDALNTDKAYHLFRGEDGAGIHVEIGADGLFNQVVFDWIDDKLR